ncbi:hypothetical protein K2X83_00670 [Patescibacteria group bacterium]|nr:hypothetical protein [Patescibacteria group bacterium]
MGFERGAHSKRHAFVPRAFFAAAAFLAVITAGPARAEELSETQSLTAIEGVDLSDQAPFNSFTLPRTTFSNDYSLGEYFQDLQNAREERQAVGTSSPEERLERAAIGFLQRNLEERIGFRMPRGLTPYAKDLGGEAGERDIVYGFRLEF